MLYYPPPSNGQLFQFLSNKAFLEDPDQWLSPELHFRSFAHTHIQMWRSEKCSTIRALPRAHCFSFWQTRLFWKAPTSSSHQNFILGHLLTPTQTSQG